MNSYRKLIFVTLVFLGLAVAANAQTVTRDFRNVPLKTVLSEVGTQSGYSFMYKDEDVADAPDVTASFKGASVNEVLDRILKGNFTYSINGKMVSITKVARRAVSAAAPAIKAEISEQKPATQTVSVNGIVVDAMGQPVIGAAVTVNDRTSLGGSITDIDGRFTIDVPEGSELLVSCIGYAAVTVGAVVGTTMTIKLEEDAQMLEDVVVVGYGVQKKESVVGAISQVGSEALVNSGTTNISNSLAGKLSGVQTFQTSGQPGASDAQIYVRGMSSWNNDDPLIMVDGVERSFSDLDPNEVATISVLKDASATAVFGAKGANGVILVTTKSGAKGKPKMHLSVDYGIDLPTNIPEHISSAKVAEMANVAYKNQQSFSALYSDEILSNFKNGNQPLRYADNDWFDLLLNDLAQTFNANYNLTGGGEKCRYFVSVGYTNEGSIVKRLNNWDSVTFNYNRINYRSNLDFDVTKTTKMALKIGGSTGVTQLPDAVSVTTLFNDMYRADVGLFPAYYPEWALAQIKDWDYPDATGQRIANQGSAFTPNPYYVLCCGDFTRTTQNKQTIDLELNQKLDSVTKGLSARFKTGLTTQFSRISQQADHDYTTYYIDWNAYDVGDSNPWISSKSSNGVEVDPPLKVSQNNSASGTQVNFYLEGGLEYSRTFGRSDVTALALYNQREVLGGSDFPTRNQGLVGRVTYGFDSKYLFEANVGYTGSEQFSPKNRFGVFPSVAAGYVLSHENFWKEAMPWWNKMKLRYSDGLVGTDSARARWLYYTAYSLTSKGYYQEQSAANDTAKWETSHKRDLGFEMGWLEDTFTLNVDLFTEHRTGMLISPVVTPLVGVSYKDINVGELKKHGYEVEAKYRKTTKGGYYYEVGGMVSFNENRIINYEDLPYAPEYQKMAGKAYKSQTHGMDVVDDTYFNSINELHGYPGATSNWDYNTLGRLKYLDYDSTGTITADDAHAIKGSTAPLYVYSFNFGFGYKGFNMNCLFYGNAGKFTEFTEAYFTEFYKGDLTAHTAQLDFWTPTNRNAAHQNMTFYGDGLTTTYTMDQTWRKSDYLKLKELYLSYKFDGDKIHRMLGINGLSLTLTGNNLFTMSGLIEGDPQRTTLSDSYYPMMRVIKLGIKVDM